MRLSFARTRFYHEWKVKQLAFRDYARRENERRYNRQRGFIINPYVFGGGAPTDPDFANVRLLCHCDGTDGSTTVPDSSSYARTVTCLGSAALDTADQRFGSASLLFNGVNSAVTVPDSASLEPGSGNFTIEMWYHSANLLQTGFFIDKRANGATGIAPCFMYVLANGTVGIQASNDGATYGLNATSSAGAIPNDTTFRHLVLERNGNAFDAYVSGTSVVSGTLSGTLHDNANDWVLGAASPDFVANLYGYLDEIRITLGVARYTGNFTPPSSPFPDS